MFYIKTTLALFIKMNSEFYVRVKPVTGKQTLVNMSSYVEKNSYYESCRIVMKVIKLICSDIL